MGAAHTTWKVLPHRPIEKLSERVWRVEGDLPDGPLKRVMSIVKRADGSLLVHNAIALEDAAMAAIEAWGPIGAIAVPNAYHRLDAGVFHARYPDAEIVCPAGARAGVTKVVPVSRTYAELPADDVLAVETLDGTKQREGALVVRAADGTTVIVNDAIFNMPHVPGFTGFVFRRLTASSGGPRVTRIARWFIVADRVAFRAHLERLAALPELRRVIVSHHVTIDRDPAAVLRAVAATLA